MGKRNNKRGQTIAEQMAILEKKFKKVEAEFETAKPLRQLRLLKQGASITKKLDNFKKVINLNVNANSAKLE